MTLYLYNLLVDPRTVDKSAIGALSPVNFSNLELGYRAIGNLRDRCSIIDPVFTLELDNGDVGKFNYLYVSEWGRYYFVRETVVERTGLVTAYCHVDVLYTYKTAILNLSAYVERNETNAKPFLTDPKRPFTKAVNRTVIDTTNTSHPFNPTFQELLGNYTIVVQCSNVNVANVQKMAQPATPDPFSVLPNESSIGKGGAVNAYVMSVGQLKNFYKLFIDANIGGSFSSYINGLAGNSTQGINSVIAYPFNLVNKGILVRNADDSADDNSRAIEIYNHTIPGQTAYELKSNACYTVDFGTWSYTVSSFKDLEPYTRADLYLPYVGTVNIPMSWLAGGGINVKYKINMFTGDALVSIVSNDVSSYVKTETAHIGLDIPLTATNNVEQARNGTMLLFNGIFGALTTPNPAQGLMTLGKDLVQLGLNTSVISTAPANSNVARMSKYDPYLIIETMTDETPVNYGHFVGYPLESVVTLSTLSGFTIVGEVFGHIADEMEDEHAEIMRLLKTGVIL